MGDEQPVAGNYCPEVRLLASFPHCGSSLLKGFLTKSHICTATSSTGAISNDVKTPETRPKGRQFLVREDEFGPGGHGDDVLVATLESPHLRPALLVRDPIQVLESCDEEGILDGYARFLKTGCESRSTHLVLYERLVLNHRSEISRLCDWWGIPFSENEATVGDGTNATLELGGGKHRNRLSNAEKDQVEEAIGRQYLRCWRDADFLELQTTLAGKSWFGFDLDDTLHEFRRASGAAVDAVLRDISSHFGTDLSLLKETHAQVLKEKTANAFSDGKTSFDYRRERFAVVLSRLSITYAETFITNLLQLYETTLTKTLELKAGALQLFATLKGLGKKIVVITEGPQDAQERTVEALGLAGYIDFLATTNHFRVSKTNGLFGKVLEHLNISPADMVFVGDNEERDVRMATSAGILSIYFAEAQDISLTVDAPRINSLRKLQYLLDDVR